MTEAESKPVEVAPPAAEDKKEESSAPVLSETRQDTQDSSNLARTTDASGASNESVGPGGLARCHDCRNQAKKGCANGRCRQCCFRMELKTYIDCGVHPRRTVRQDVASMRNFTGKLVFARPMEALPAGPPRGVDPTQPLGMYGRPPPQGQYYPPMQPGMAHYAHGAPPSGPVHYGQPQQQHPGMMPPPQAMPPPAVGGAPPKLQGGYPPQMSPAPGRHIQYAAPPPQQQRQQPPVGWAANGQPVYANAGPPNGYSMAVPAQHQQQQIQQQPQMQQQQQPQQPQQQQAPPHHLPPQQPQQQMQSHPPPTYPQTMPAPPPAGVGPVMGGQPKPVYHPSPEFMRWGDPIRRGVGPPVIAQHSPILRTHHRQRQLTATIETSPQLQRMQNGTYGLSPQAQRRGMMRPTLSAEQPVGGDTTQSMYNPRNQAALQGGVRRGVKRNADDRSYIDQREQDALDDLDAHVKHPRN